MEKNGLRILSWKAYIALSHFVSQFSFPTFFQVEKARGFGVKVWVMVEIQALGASYPFVKDSGWLRELLCTPPWDLAQC